MTSLLSLGLVEVVFKNSKEISKIQATLLNEREAHPNFFYNLTQGLYETILIISGEHYEAIKNQLAIVDVVREEGNLSLVTIRLPDTSLPVPGVYYPILRALAWEGISFVEIVSVSTELSILFEDSVVDRAFSVIKRMTSEG